MNINMHYKEVHKVAKGRYVHFEVNLNADGTFLGTFTVENMQALAGTHAGGFLDWCDGSGNVLGRLVMPRLGVNAAGFAKRVTRVSHFSGALAPEQVGRITQIRSAGYEDAGVNVAELLGIFRELRRG